ncbi:MAG: DUF3560 domain-containing protein [Myxococcales bacterium]|nr:DUF3560 domain-containing protein [Myxococcales bacterium]
MPDGHTAGPAGPTTKDSTTTTDETAELVVRYRYGEGILLHGDTYPHKDAIKKAVPKWRWFRSMRQWGVTATRDKAMHREAVQRYADGLTKAGLPRVRVDYEAPKPEDVRPMAEVFEERQARSRRRAQRASERADRLEQEAVSHYEASHDAVRNIPLGQPILVGHHSQRKHERDVQRARAAMDRSAQAQREAERARAQAHGSEAEAASRETPAFAIRRLRELATEARVLEVRLTGKAPPDWRGAVPRGPATGDDRSMLRTLQREVQGRIDHFRSLLEEAHVPAARVAPKPLELVITDRGEAITIKTTPKMVRVKRDGRVVSVARDHVWVPKAILALRPENQLSRDEARMLWRAQHEDKTRAISPEDHDALESLVGKGLVIAHPDMKYAGLYLVTDQGKAWELPEGKPKTWIRRWDGLRATPAPEDEAKRRRVAPEPQVEAERKAEPEPKAKPEPATKTRRGATAGPRARTGAGAKAGAKATPRVKLPAEADRLAERLGLEPKRTPTIGRMREAMVQAVREDLGPEMKAWFVQHTRSALKDIDAAFGYGRGVVALENDGWPPDPLRGTSYGEEHFRGLVHSLEHLPEVVELLEAALSWDDDMTEATGSRRHTHWFDDGRIAELARRIMSDLHLERVSRPKQRTPQRAEELREWVRRSALSHLARLRIPLDPSLYDPQADPEVVYRKVCEVDSEAARKILDEIFGVEFASGVDGRVDAAEMCRGKKTLDDLRAEAGERAAAEAKEDATRTAARRRDAEALLRVANAAAKRGPISTRRFNNAYWRLHPELRAKRKRYALMVERKGPRSEASVQGPGDERFFVSIEGDGEDAQAALLRMLLETTGESVGSMVADEAVESATARKATTTAAKSTAAPAAKKARRSKNPEPTAEVDVDAIAKEAGISSDRWPPFDKLEAAFLAAERRGAGSDMRKWFQARKLHRPEDLARMHGRVRGILALEGGVWPPPPLRGKTYGREHVGGILSALDRLPVVVELEALARKWPERMKVVTRGHWRYWYDDGRMAYLASGTVRDLNASIMRGVTHANKATEALAHEAREKIEASAQQQIERLTATLDPALYDPKTPPEDVYPRLCEIESDLARKVLKDVHGVRFDWHRAGRTDAYKLCQGETTIAEIERKADVREAEDRAREAESKAHRAADARALLKVRSKVAKGGEVTPKRFNLAYWRAHPEIAKHERPHRRLRIRSDQAAVRGPTDYGFSVRLYGQVGEAEAVAALFEEVREAAGLETASATEETAKAKVSSATSKKGPRSSPSPKKGSGPTTRRAEAGSAERTVRSILSVRIAEDGPEGVSELSTEHEPSLVRAVRRMAKRGEVVMLKSPRGRVWIKAGPKWEPVAFSEDDGEVSATEPEPAANEPPPPSSSTAPPERPPGSLWSVEEEGFALVAPRGEGQQVQVPTAVQSPLLDVGKPDREAMERIRERELAERRGPAKAEPPAPLLEAEPSPPDRVTLFSGRTITPIREDAPLPEDFPVYGPDDTLTYGPKYAAYMAHHGETSPSHMMGRDTARHPNPLEGYLQWLREHPREPKPAAELERSPEAEPSAEPTARLEYVDVATGTPTDPGEPGTLSTGRVVAEIDGETVEVDEEDLLGHGSDPDPRKRRYRFDVDSPADYPGQAQAKKTARAAKKGSTKARAKAKAGLRSTFDSAKKAAALFYEHNADFFDHVLDPWDGLRDWMDGIEVRAGRSTKHRKLSKTAAGKRILGQKHAAVAIRHALAYLLGQAKGRRWEDVPWGQVDRLGEALERYYEAPGSEAGQPGIYWRPFTGTVRAEDLDAMSPEQREAIRVQEAAQEIGEQLEQLREAYARAKDCLPKDVRRVIERRIAEWDRWMTEPAEIPDYACEPDPETAGYLCNYPSVAGELSELRRSCEDAYDPNWAAEESKKGAAGFPDTSGGEDELPATGSGASAKACCSRELDTPPPARPARTTPAQDPPTTSAKARGGQATKKKTGRAPPRAPKKTSAKKPRTRAKAPSKEDKGPSRTTSRHKDAKVLAAQRRADRLACSADAARHQAETIDTDSYRERLQSAKEAVKEAERLNTTRCKELDAAKKHQAKVRAKADTGPKELAQARRRVHDARCQLQLARSALSQRKRDHKRAATELRKAELRVKSRKAVADKRERIAKQAKAKAGALDRRT